MAFYNLGMQLYRAHQAFADVVKVSLRPLKITPSQVNLLLHIDRLSNSSAADIADKVAVTPQAMHRTVVALEQRGLVKRTKRADNQKTFFLSLTESGEATLRRAEIQLKTVQDTAAQIFSMQEQDIDIFHKLLKQYETAFKIVARGDRNES